MSRVILRRSLFLLALAVLGPAGPATAQQAGRYALTGTAVQEDGRPIAGVQVAVRGTNQGTITDAQGRFTVSAALNPGRYTVEFTFIGRQTVTREVALSAERSVALGTITMAVSVVQLQEIVVSGPGAASERRALGNSVATVSGEATSRAPATGSVGVALQGKITGALVNVSNGQPGSPITIRLRGNNSILGTAEPLVVVDGVIIDNTTDALLDISTNATRGGSGMSSRLSDISPDDIERVEVLKGASAAALYGSRAKNGVLQIFTRRGQQGEARVTWGTELEINETPRRLELNMAPFASAADVAIAAAAGVKGPGGAALKVGDPVTRYDVQDQLFRTGTGVNTMMSVSGGAGNSTYYLSGAFRNDQSVMRGADAQRYSVRGRLTQQIGDRIEVTGSGSYIKSHVDFVPEGEQSYGALTSAVFTPTIFNASFSPDLGRFPYNPVLAYNPLDVIENWEAPEDVSRFLGSVEASYRPLENLSLRYLFGIDDYRQENKFLIPPFSQSATNLGSIQNPLRLSTSTNHDLTANLDTRFGENITLGTLLGFRYTRQVTDILRPAGTNLSPGQTLVGGATQSATQSINELRTNSVFAQGQLALNRQVFLTAGFNYEASSAFGEDQRWQWFPKLGASFMAYDDAETPLAGAISSLRLRTAYGETGGQPPGLYDRFSNYINTSFSGRPGLIASTRAANPELKPERQREVEMGFDLGLWRDRAQLEFTLYDQRTTDLVLDVPLSPTTGFTVQRQNVGEVKNQGVELTLNTINLSSDRFTWRSRFGFASNRNKVTQLVTSTDTIVVGYLNAVIKDKPIGVFYGGQYDRDETTRNIIYCDRTNANFPGQTLRLPERKRTVRCPAPGVAATFINRIIGDPNPDWTANFSNTLNIGENLEITALLDGRFGNDVANFTRRITEFFGSDKVIEKEINGDTIPMTYGRNPNNRISIYEEYIEDGSFVKLREVTLSYRVRHPIVQRLGASAMTLTLAGRNLKTWTDYRGLDPELNLFSANTVAQGVDFSNTPLARSYVFGVNFTF
jgi:TonB-linked SusC/RagA family outer membrane protein